MNPIIPNAEFRVIHVFPYSANWAGGHTNAAIAIMKAQRQHGIEVRGLSPFSAGIPSALWRSVETLPVQELDFTAPNPGQGALELAAGCSRPIFHFHGFMERFVPVGRELTKAGIPYVITSQGQLHYRQIVHWAMKFVYLNFVTRFFRNASGLHFTTQRARTRCRYLIPGWERPVLVQHNLVEVPDPATVSPASREHHGIPARAFLFAYLGRLDIEHKGLDVLVRSLAGLPSGSHLHLALIGPDWARGKWRLQRLAQRLNCAANVHFLGPHYGNDKWDLLRMADAFVSPSRWEACSSAVAEAIAFGLPTVVSERMNAAMEFAAEGAVLTVAVSPGALSKAMHQMANDLQLRQSLREAGLNWTREHCSLQKAGARFRDFYLQVLRETKVPRPLV